MIMKIPQEYRPREGDIVSITATVKYDLEPSETALHLTIGTQNEVVFLGGRNAPDITLKRRVFHIGEFVQLVNGDGSRLQVHALSKDWVWTIADDGCPKTYSAHALEPYPDRRPEVVAEPPGESAEPLPELRSDGAEDDQGEVQF